MEKLMVRNFGPIEEVDIEIKDINVFIGKTSSGKSTVAKLISIFHSSEFLFSDNYKSFRQMLIDYNIDFEIGENTSLEYIKGNYKWRIVKDEFQNNYPFKTLFPALQKLFESSDQNNSHHNAQSFLSWVTIMNLENSELHAQEPLVSYNSVSLAAKINEVVNIRKKLEDRELRTLGGTDYVIKELYLELQEDLNYLVPTYIPAERNIISMVGESIFGLLNNNVTLAKCVKDFGSVFETARKKNLGINMDLLGARFVYHNGENLIQLSDGNTIKLEKASSGFQSLTPMFVVLADMLLTSYSERNLITIEEPELNLYPTAQKELTEFVISIANHNRNKLIITTHSPYILTTIDNLIQAKNSFNTKNELINEIKSIVPENIWVEFESVTCHYFEDGRSNSTLDNENRSIGASNIDDVSTELSETFEKLLDLKYS